MPTPPRLDLGELAISATLWSIYGAARTTAGALGVMQLLTR
jgi:hypothetical protein